ncbi:hypothetical protein F5B19DRAFT_129562 [Rostrohypoxylon terebratum]|nr:hypothetical protein F5B19DRAFT_129562 [Rostrohypoxylon terebratum]
MAVGNADDQATSSQNRVTNSKKYFEVCVSVGRYAINLGEIDISSITSDGQLFDEIWKTYRGMKGKDWKAALRNWFLEPDDILFVLFGVVNRHQVGIYKQPLEIPPKIEVDEGRYEYYECPMRDLPPMPGNIFLHYLEHAKKKASAKKEMPLYHMDSTFLSRLPKKLGNSIFDHAATAGSRMSFGWGVHIVERPSITAQNLVAGFVALFSVVICLAVFAITRTTYDLDEANGIGQYAIAVLALLNIAFRFFLQAYCSSLSPWNSSALT